MSTTTNLHRVTSIEAVELGNASSLKLTDDNGNSVTVFMDYERAVAMAEAWEDSDREPEAPDAETIAAREESYRRAMNDAGRGHLVRS